MASSAKSVLELACGTGRIAIPLAVKGAQVTGLDNNESMLEQARRNGSGKAVTNPVARWLRDRMLPLFLRLGERAQHRTYAHRIAWAGGR